MHTFLKIILLIFISTPPVLGQIDTLLQSMQRLQQQRDSLSAEYRTAERESQRLAAAIDSLQQSPLSLAQRQQLVSKMQQASRLADAQQSRLGRLAETTDSLETIHQNLFQRYSTKLDSAREALAAQPRRRRNAAELERLRRQMQRFHPSNYVPGLDADILLAIHADDTPEEINLKAAVYRDRAESLRAKADDLTARISAVRNEQQLRQRLGDMIDDVNLLSAQGEIQPSTAPATRSLTEALPEEKYDTPAGPTDNTGITNSLTVQQANLLLDYDFRSMSSVDFDSYLETLDQQSRLLFRQADSLSEVADEFETVADEMTNQLR